VPFIYKPGSPVTSAGLTKAGTCLKAHVRCKSPIFLYGQLPQIHVRLSKLEAVFLPDTLEPA
jgi:hypothetical protein